MKNRFGPAPKPLTKTQIEATIERMCDLFGPTIKAHNAAFLKPIREKYDADCKAAEKKAEADKEKADAKHKKAVCALFRTKDPAQTEWLFNAIYRNTHRYDLPDWFPRREEVVRENVPFPPELNTYGPAHAVFQKELADLRYALVMADNTDFQHYIDKFQQQITKMLKK